MSDKIHLLITVEPLKDGEELIALCGEKLPPFPWSIWERA